MAPLFGAGGFRAWRAVRPSRRSVPGRSAMGGLALTAAAMGALAAAAVDAKETELKSEIAATETINPSRRGTPQPVKVHIFYLAQDEAFMQANFADLVNPEAAVLGDELVRRAEQLIGPGERLELDEKFDEAAQFIGVIAEFTELDRAAWRAIVAVPVKRWTDVRRLFKKSKLEILVDGTTVSCAIVEE
jgi:type VI secretion system protein VasD